MLIDEISISVKAGNGGDGRVHLYHDGQRPKGGPDGGKGGDGGSVFFKVVDDIGRLLQFRYLKKFEAENGDMGGVNQKSGKNGKDLILEIPLGSIVHYDNGTSFEASTVGEIILVAQGGKGGWGNFHFRSATNQTPTQRQLGFVTTPKNLFIELKLIADVGLIGLPNVGKSSLLNELTAAHAKVANYSFTTLEPNLGVSRGGKIIADIPGIIEGASSGKGLGIKFLKHIERTKLLIHCLSAESTDLKKDYEIIRQEIANYSSELMTKPELIVITKSDIKDKISPSKIKFLAGKEILYTSILDDSSIKKLSDKIHSSFS